MPTTLTLKNIPDELYGRLKQAAEVHHRSLNSEVIAIRWNSAIGSTANSRFPLFSMN